MKSMRQSVSFVHFDSLQILNMNVFPFYVPPVKVFCLWILSLLVIFTSLMVLLKDHCPAMAPTAACQSADQFWSFWDFLDTDEDLEDGSELADMSQETWPVFSGKEMDVYPRLWRNWIQIYRYFIRLHRESKTFDSAANHFLAKEDSRFVVKVVTEFMSKLAVWQNESMSLYRELMLDARQLEIYPFNWKPKKSSSSKLNRDASDTTPDIKGKVDLTGEKLAKRWDQLVEWLSRWSVNVMGKNQQLSFQSQRFYNLHNDELEKMMKHDEKQSENEGDGADGKGKSVQKSVKGNETSPSESADIVKDLKKNLDGSIDALITKSKVDSGKSVSEELDHEDEKGGEGQLETVMKLKDEEDEEAPAAKEDLDSYSNNYGESIKPDSVPAHGGKPITPSSDKPSTSTTAPAPASNPIANQPPSDSQGASLLLLDSQNNRYVLAHTHDPLHQLISDVWLFRGVLWAVGVSAFTGLLTSQLGLPSFFGYIIAGVVLGPGELDYIKSTVQLEALAQLGVLFILFVLGLEFSTTSEHAQKNQETASIHGYDADVEKKRCKSVFQLSLTVTALLAAGCILVMISVGSLIGMSSSLGTDNTGEKTSLGSFLGQLAYFGVCIGFSSTAVVLQCLQSNAPKEPRLYKNIITNVLIMQDVALGFFLALLPAFTHQHQSTGGGIVWRLGLTSFRAALFLLLSVLIRICFIKPFVTWLTSKEDVRKDLVLLLALSSCFGLCLMSEWLHVSWEVASFVAGISVGKSFIGQSSTSSWQTAVHEQLEGICSFFSCIFFTSIGLHIYASFMLQQAILLLMLSLCIICVKTTIMFTTIHYIYEIPVRDASIIAIGLSQVSEFAMVLASKAFNRGILGRQAYFILVGVSCLSLLITPFMWRTMRSFKLFQVPEPTANDRMQQSGSSSPSFC